MFKKFLPRSLFGRFLLIILVPNIIVQMVAIYIFYERHWSGVSKHMTVALAGDVSMLVRSMWSAPLDERERIMNIAHQTLYLEAEFLPGKELRDVNSGKPSSDFDYLSDELSNKLPVEYKISYTPDHSEVAIDAQLSDGVIHIVSSHKRLDNPSTYIFIMWMTGSAMTFLLISIAFMRNQIRSITKLAFVADRFGKGQEADDFKPSGAFEVRMVGQAFIEMRDRIKKQVEQRTEMLAGVSHDLKTPMTRIKLQMAMMKQTKEIKELQEDITEMEKMVQGYLDFANGKERVTDSAVNISELLRSVVAGYKNYKREINLKTKSGVVLHGNANSLRRTITNIIDNALRYGKNIEINLSNSTKNVIITIDDDGPGIPANKRDDVFKPFFRLDKSRHLEGGNTGLGLSIAKDIVVGHGGEISLDDSPLGGLRVVIKLPV